MPAVTRTAIEAGVGRPAEELGAPQGQQDPRGKRGQRDHRSSKRTSQAIGGVLAAAGLVLAAGCAGGVDVPVTPKAVAKNLDLADAVLSPSDGPQFSNLKDRLREGQRTLEKPGSASRGISGEEMRKMLEETITDPPQCNPAKFFDDEAAASLDDPYAMIDNPDMESVSFRFAGEKDEADQQPPTGPAFMEQPEQTSYLDVPEFSLSDTEVSVYLSTKDSLHRKEDPEECAHVTQTMEFGDIRTTMDIDTDTRDIDIPGADQARAVTTTSTTRMPGLPTAPTSTEHAIETKVGPYYVYIRATGPEGKQRAEEYAKKQVDKLYEVSS